MTKMPENKAAEVLAVLKARFDANKARRPGLVPPTRRGGARLAGAAYDCQI